MRLTYREWIRPGDGVLDIGANEGRLTEAFAELVGDWGYVLAIEPHPATILRLRERCIRFPWVQSMQVAVADLPGRRLYYEDGKDDKQNSLLPGAIYTPGGATHDVVTVTVDELVRAALKPIRCIKVDTQGAEPLVLAGASATLDQPIAWFIELWTNGYAQCGLKLEDMLTPFESRGFTPWHEHGDAWTWDGVRDLAVKKPRGFDVFCTPKGTP